MGAPAITVHAFYPRNSRRENIRKCLSDNALRISS